MVGFSLALKNGISYLLSADFKITLFVFGRICSPAFGSRPLTLVIKQTTSVTNVYTTRQMALEYT